MLLCTDKLTKDYGSSRALDEVSFTVSPGEILGLLGPNGSGKSTSLRLLLGFLRPTSGRATIAGHDCWSDGVAARRQVAYLPGDLRLYETMTGRQLVRFLSRLRGHPEYREIDALARRFDIDLDLPLSQLSSGMKRKVALLLVLAPHTPLLILDEPTNTLDPTMRAEFLEQLRKAREHGRAVLFSSHVLGEVEQVCDRVAILRKGRLVHVQDMRKLRDGRRLRIRFSNPPGDLPDLPGLTLCERVDGQLVIEHTGPLPPLLAWLSTQPVIDLRAESLGLAPIYRQYHGAES